LRHVPASRLRLLARLLKQSCERGDRSQQPHRQLKASAAQ
jgi:hypothetical protein